MTVIKGHKYILAGNFPAEHKQTFIDTLTKELEIEIVAVITSDNTHFIEYFSEEPIDYEAKIEIIEEKNNTLIEEGAKVFEENKKLKARVDELMQISEQRREIFGMCKQERDEFEEIVENQKKSNNNIEKVNRKLFDENEKLKQQIDYYKQNYKKKLF